MTNLSKPLRAKLDGIYEITAPEVARKQVSQKDGTIKYLWRLSDGNCVESVVMQYHHGNTVCISSEVGCLMGCKFCASTLGGLVRRLRPSELLDQVLFSQIDSGLPISNIVLMGIGEPLDNYESTVKFLRLVSSEEGLNIGLRHISVSTCGIVPGIVKVGGWFELLFVNGLGMSFNSGVVVYIILLAAALIWGVYESYTEKSRLRMAISFILTIALLGIPFYGHGVSSILIGIVVIAILGIYLAPQVQ